MQRVMIVGQPGSGKSTLARKLGEHTGLPVVHIDTIHWLPGWVERTCDEKTRLCREVEARDRWIFEGGHSATWDNRLSRADLLIWIDRSATLRFWRVLLRTLLKHGRSRPDLPENCPERLANLPEFFRFMWRTKKSARAKMEQLVATAPSACRVVCLRSNRDTRIFLANIGNVD
ncbi:AAA family ATPase [Pseudomonas sp. Fig-3]|uniref:AAA family ATPase n=1 Tax=Pseudomonas TaxID=286 RepID=UPI001111C795|nr:MULTISPECIES: AAA family ATPase [unclassified Pseudomonas]MBD0705983.1 AAA family ATPase [Pseudomonas sp. PSB1]MDR8388835.1 AAA family ATPase [Pseudomonas sp. JL2]TNB89270.1 AAA family ATPase [Pseudomonas sp. Fig-3]WNZ78590.1 AAA family ATPase [Pseudomonas sp. P105]